MINILKNTRVYLAGNMEYTSDSVNWRNYITVELNKLNIRSLSPLDVMFTNQINESHEDRESLINKRRLGLYDEVSEYMKGVVQKDLRLIDICDFVIVNLEINKPTVGTIHELITANIQKKPIFLIVGDKKETPLWLLGILSPKYIYNNIDEVLNVLTSIDSGEKEIDSDRWRLLINNFR